ncbi:MAG: porin family protein [Bacteroidia bacterium]
MKKFNNKITACLCAAVLLCAVSLNAVAQETSSAKKTEFGFRFMPTYSSFDMKTSEGGTVSGDVTLGFGMGALLGFSFSNHVGIQGELIYSSVSQKFNDKDVQHKVSLKYINVPLLLTLNTGKSKVINLNIVGGPQIGFNVGSSITTSGTADANNTQPVLSVKKGDLGVAYGAGADIALTSAHTLLLSLGYRGVLGLVDISDQSSSITTDSYYVLDRTHLKTNSVYAGLTLMF